MGIAIITGASSGIGREFAVQLDSRGLDSLWLIARRKQRLEELAASLDTPCDILPFDLTNDQDLEKIRKKIEKEKPDITYMVNNAGFGKSGTIDDVDLDSMIGMVDVNVRAVVFMSKVTIPYMRQGGSYIHVSSSAGFLPMGGFNEYASTKAFVAFFSVGLRAELEHRKVHSIAVCPGPVQTEFSQVAHAGSGRKKKMFTRKKNAAFVVKKALKDTARKKTFSMYWPITLIKLIAKLLPAATLARFALRKVYAEEKK